MKPDKVLSMLGIAAKAGGVASGEFSTEKAVKDGRAWLVIVASDASENTQKHFRDMTTFMKFRCMCTEKKRHWDISLERNSVHRLQ